MEHSTIKCDIIVKFDSFQVSLENFQDFERLCLRDATELTNIDLLCTFITCTLTVCYVPLKFLDCVTLIAIIFIITGSLAGLSPVNGVHRSSAET